MTTKSNFEKKYLLVINTITVIAIILGCFIHVGGWILGGHKGSTLINGRNASAEGGDLGVWSEDEISALSVKLDIGELTLTEGDEYKVEYHGYPEGKEPVVSIEGDTLTIVQKSGRGLNPGISGSDCGVVVTVPDGDRPSVELTLSMGALECKDLELGNVTISSSMGSATVKDCETGTLDIEANMGEIDVKDTEFTTGSFEDDMGSITLKDVDFEEAVCEANMGSIEVSGDFGKLTATCDMGSIRVDADNDDAKVDLSADMGDVRFNGEDRGRNYTR